MKISSSQKDDFLYLQVASRIENLIEKEVLKIGDKLPSVRSLSKEQGISVSTAFQAYYLLENKGYIEPRPKSGYFVKFSTRKLPRLPAPSQPKPVAREVSMAEMVSRVYKDLTNDNVVRLSVSAPSIELLPTAKLNKALMHVMRSIPGHGFNYESLLGNSNLRKQIAKKAFDSGASVSDEEIVITNGCMEAVLLSLRAVTQPGDTIVVESPIYFGILQAIENLGLKVVELPADPVTGINLNELHDAIKRLSIKACLLIPNFSNPLGSCMPDEHKKELVEMLASYEIPLIEDDIYGDLYFGKSRPRTCKSYDQKGLVLLCASVSKTLAPGYRVGWVIPGKFKDKIINLKLTSTITSPSITQAAVGHFLETGRYDNHLKRLRSALHAQVLRYSQAIASYFPEGTHISRPVGGFVLWVEVPRQVDSFDLLNLCEKYHINFAPGQIFSSQNRYKNCMRISCGFPWSEKIDLALATLGKLVSSY